MLIFVLKEIHDLWYVSVILRNVFTFTTDRPTFSVHYNKGVIRDIHTEN
jgi:hypothetical protein